MTQDQQHQQPTEVMAPPPNMALQTRDVDLLADAYKVDKIVQQVEMVTAMMGKVMKAGQHFGTIPGCGTKPSLFLPGAQKLCFLFRLKPEFTLMSAIEDEDFIKFTFLCRLIHMPSGQVVGEGIGSCSSREEKYGWRQGSRTCPKCGKEGTIIKGKQEYGGGWLCFGKKGGCGEKFADADPAITKQTLERVPNPNIWDLHNTLLKMAKKRAYVDATITATAVGDLFTQDLEDMKANQAAATATGETAPVIIAKDVIDKLPAPTALLALRYNIVVIRWPDRAGEQFERDFFRDSKGAWYKWETVEKITNTKGMEWIGKINLKLETEFGFTPNALTFADEDAPIDNGANPEDLIDENIPF
jgi:hypothetical protein